MFTIDHLGIAVKSLAAAKRIYEKLGLSVSAEETVDAEQVRLVMVPVGESRLELLEPTSENSPIAKFISKHGEGLHHVSLRVPDLAATVERLKKDGVRLVSNDIKVGAGGHRYIFIHPGAGGGVLGVECSTWNIAHSVPRGTLYWCRCSAVNVCTMLCNWWEASRLYPKKQS